MGIRAYKQAWSAGPMPPTALLVLLALADHIRDTGDGWCWPSHETLAGMVGIDRSNVKRRLAWLENAGLIEVDRKPGWTNRYRLTQGATALPTQRATAPRGRAVATKRGGGTALQTLRTRNNQDQTHTPPPLAQVLEAQNRFTQ